MPNENDVPAWAMKSIVEPLGEVKTDLAVLTQSAQDQTARYEREQKAQDDAIEAQGDALSAHAEKCPIVRLHTKALWWVLGSAGVAGFGVAVAFVVDKLTGG